MARRATAELAFSSQDGARLPRVLMWAVAGLLAATLTVFLAMQVEHFLVRDPRFVLQPPASLGMPTAGFHTSGLFYTTEAQVQRVFVRDFGRSIYLCPIAERRRLLLGVDWVEEATVSRIWPNQISVAIRERKPIAFAQVAYFDGSVVPKLIDRDGMLLEPQRAVRLKLPLLSGVRNSDTPALRRERVARLLQLEGAIGKTIDKVSDIDISDTQNVRLTLPIEGRMLTLLLGSQDFKERLDNMVNSYPEISKRLPSTTIFDLRVPGRITAAPSVSAIGGSNGFTR